MGTQTIFVWGWVGAFFAWVLCTLGFVYIFLHFIQSHLSGNVKAGLLD